ncbi:MAG: hypothetical protein ACFFD4_09740 [Candidatus Odinarchaeota archaeon]
MFFIKKGKFKEFSISSVFLVLLVVTPGNSIKFLEEFTPSEPHSANAMWLEPSSVITAKLGAKFNVTAYMNLTQKSFTWQIKLSYNSTYLNATRAGYTNGSTSAFFAGHSPVSITPRIDNEEGYILGGETLLGSDERVPGYGSLMWVEFDLIKLPPQNHSTLYFSVPYGIDTFILSPLLEIIPLQTINDANITISQSTTTTGAPSFPDINMIILVAIIIIVAVAMLVIIRRRRSKKHE